MQLLDRVGAPAGERVQPLVVEHGEERVRVVGNERRQPEAFGLDAVGTREPVDGIDHADDPRSPLAGGPLTTIEPGTAAASVSAWPR